MLIKPSVSLYDLCGHGQVSQFHIYVVRFLSVIALVRAFSGHCEMLMSIFCILHISKIYFLVSDEHPRGAGGGELDGHRAVITFC